MNSSAPITAPSTPECIRVQRDGLERKCLADSLEGSVAVKQGFQLFETRKRRVNVGATDDMEETGEAKQATGFGQTAPAAGKPPLPNFTPIEGSEQKPQHPRGRLSENTLKVMLEAQELK